ncbi:haloacid dehalogenase [Labrys miyagiensis]|uniref:phosphoglycolate phosphatase n=1 Tax=Labrys miyagiensis TaxID=346912 RepID=A0ABQ6CTR0_9HYPH|nr:HAD family phosphatase [Labrys miyagiensis]GLS23145.1 haloacid dehalogenase [Labrys miyagiensis]
MSVKAVAWDIDGTLADSEPLHEKVLFEVCQHFGADISDLPPDHFRGVHMGDVWAELKGRFSPDTSEEAWQEAIIDTYVEKRAGIRVMDGALETVKALAAAGIRQGCVSNSSRRIVDANVEALGIAGYLDFSISLDDVERGKPDPEPYAQACHRFGLAPGEVLAVEDSFAGFSSATGAGLVTAFYAPAGGGIEGADHVITDLRRVRDLIDEETIPA